LGKPLRRVQSAFGAFRVQSRGAPFKAPSARSRFKTRKPFKKKRIFIGQEGQKEMSLQFFAIFAFLSEAGG